MAVARLRPYQPFRGSHRGQFGIRTIFRHFDEGGSWRERFKNAAVLTFEF
jgi:hypothetical protein